MAAWPACGADVLEIDVRCSGCGAVNGASGAHRMVGQVMLGQYELVDVLGQGGMSVVFKGRHKLTEQEVALKILPPELAAHSQVKSRFLDEAKALAALDHPNIVHLYNFGQENGFFVLAMQYVKGQTWERLILENKRLDWKISSRICVDVLRALEYAHGCGVVHRDMKPSNVLVKSHDGSATVMDFGIAKMTTSTRLTATGQTMGTVRYMSPEQVRGQEVDLRTDIYSLGATLYESLTGDTPFDGQTHFEIMTKHLSELPKRPSALGVEVPLSIEDALMRTLAKRAEDRFESAREIRKILEAALRQADVSLVDTQKLDREILGELRSSVGPTTGTATELAEQLEPQTTAASPRRPRNLLPWIALGGIATAATVLGVVLLTRDDTPAPPPSTIPGIVLTDRAQVGTVVIETDGLVPAAQVATEYAAALAGLRETVRTAKPGIELVDPVDAIVAMPQSALCLPAAYVDAKAIPADCQVTSSIVTIGPRGSHRLFVVSDPARLSDAIRRGAVQAVCDFQPGEPEQVAEICDLARIFAEPGRR